MSSGPQTILINEEPYVLVITRNMSFWHQCLSVAGHFLYSKDFSVHAQSRQIAITKHGTETSLFCSLENLAAYGQSVLQAVDTFEKIQQLTNHYHVFAKKALDALRAALVELNPETWHEFQEAYKRFAAGLFLTSIIGRAVPELLIEQLSQKGYSEEDISTIIGAITYPEEHTPLFDSRLDLLVIGKEVQSGTLSDVDIDDRLNAWLSMYGFIPVNFCEEPWTLDDAKKQLQEVLSSDCAEAYQKALDHHGTIIAEGKKWLVSIADEKIACLAKAVQVGTTLNEFRKNVFCRISYEYRPIFHEIATRGNLPHWRSCFYLRPEEMIEILKGGLTDANALVAEREVVGNDITDEGEIVWLKEEDTKMLSSYLASVQGQTKETGELAISVKGMIACKGKATGTAKIILSSKDFPKFSAGDILVTTMTSVDFVPLMQMAAAFVTNEGGVTSHASIVAREMNKPCVIGTKNATQVFRDGDIIEVNAETGIVFRLS